MEKQTNKKTEELKQVSLYQIVVIFKDVFFV